MRCRSTRSVEVVRRRVRSDARAFIRRAVDAADDAYAIAIARRDRAVLVWAARPPPASRRTTREQKPGSVGRVQPRRLQIQRRARPARFEARRQGVSRSRARAWCRRACGNFFTNLLYPTTVVNQFLQGKFKEGGQDTLRFVINTTLGWGGIFDVASRRQAAGARRGFGPDAGSLGRAAGPLPGAAVPRPGDACATRRRGSPTISISRSTGTTPDNERWFSLGLQFVDQRARLLPLDRMLSETYDPYAFVRDAYLQRRVNARLRRRSARGRSRDEDDADWAEEAIKEDEAGAPASEPVQAGAGAATTLHEASRDARY